MEKLNINNNQAATADNSEVGRPKIINYFAAALILMIFATVIYFLKQEWLDIGPFLFYSFFGAVLPTSFFTYLVQRILYNRETKNILLKLAAAAFLCVCVSNSFGLYVLDNFFYRLAGPFPATILHLLFLSFALPMVLIASVFSSPDFFGMSSHLFLLRAMFFWLETAIVSSILISFINKRDSLRKKLLSQKATIGISFLLFCGLLFSSSSLFSFLFSSFLFTFL
jgi:hypothetical protein